MNGGSQQIDRRFEWQSEFVSLICPRCRNALTHNCDADVYSCQGCECEYPQHAGVPDLRVLDDPYLDRDADYDRTEKVLDALAKEPDLASLLAYYWSLSDVTPVQLRPKFIRSALLAENKSARIIKLLKTGHFALAPAPQRVLEIGSGTGGFLVAASRAFPQVVGVDIGMRWLHVGRRRFADAGQQPVPLVCCSAEFLPFENASFDLVVCSSTLEFSQDVERVMCECARVLTPGGALYVNTVNRFSIAKNPYAYLWGVGCLPRKWQAPYVRWRRNASFENIHMLSLQELKRLASRHFENVNIRNFDVDDETLAAFAPLVRAMAKTYRVLAKTPLASSMLRQFGPGWDAVFSKPLS